MQIELVKEHEDGSATYTVDMTPEETKMMVLFAIRRALEEALTKGKEWHDEDLEEALTKGKEWHDEDLEEALTKAKEWHDEEWTA